MRRFLQRFPSLLARNFHLSPANFRHSNANLRGLPSSDRYISRFAFFSSESASSRGSKSDEVISTEEMKKRIQKILDDGNEDALPDLYEAMMNRKLSGKHEESDDEVMEVVRKYPVNDGHKVDDADSDIESDGLSDGDSSDTDIEIDRLRDTSERDRLMSDHIERLRLRYGRDFSDSDIESDRLSDVVSSDRPLRKNFYQKADHSTDSDSESD